MKMPQVLEINKILYVHAGMLDRALSVSIKVEKCISFKNHEFFLGWYAVILISKSDFTTFLFL